MYPPNFCVALAYRARSEIFASIFSFLTSSPTRVLLTLQGAELSTLSLQQLIQFAHRDVLTKHIRFALLPSTHETSWQFLLDLLDSIWRELYLRQIESFAPGIGGRHSNRGSGGGPGGIGMVGCPVRIEGSMVVWSLNEKEGREFSLISLVLSKILFV